jgi:hypothetical protein
LARYKHFYAGSLNVVDMHKNIRAAIIGDDETKSAICVEEFDPSARHSSAPFEISPGGTGGGP